MASVSQRPEIPYQPGYSLVCRRHVPGQVPISRDLPLVPSKLSRGLDLMTPSQQLQQAPPPAAGKTDEAHGNTAFVVQKPLTNKECHGAIVVLASDGEKVRVIKLYDPLYYPSFSDPDSPGLWPQIIADQHYFREVTAYRRLQHRQGTLIPRCYGSYTTHVPTPGYATRIVRLLVLEYLQGETMNTLEPGQYSRQEREQIMIGMIEAESIIEHDGVVHGDLHPRNVVVCEKASTFRVSLIDFASSEFWEDRNNLYFEKKTTNLPVSPTIRWSQEGRRWKFQSWVQDFDWQKWIRDVWGNSTKFESSPALIEWWC